MYVLRSSTRLRKEKKTITIGGEKYQIEPDNRTKSQQKLDIASEFITVHGEEYGEAGCLRMCKVGRSSYTNRKKNELKEGETLTYKKQEDLENKAIIRKILKGLSGFIPGERVLRNIFWRDYQKVISRKRIRRYMREMGLYASSPRKDAYKGQAKHDHPYTAPENLVKQNFRVAPRKIICTDVTYLYYGKQRSLFYLCVFKDAFTKEILGYSIDTSMTVNLIKTAYDDMMENHGKEIRTNNVIINSDQGSQYLSTTFTNLLSSDGLFQSISARANSQDNAPAESFFSVLKKSLLSQLRLCKDLQTAVEMTAQCIDEYNNERYQYTLGGLTPVEYYLYYITGIYPCDTYYGKTATSLYSLEDIVSDDIRRHEEILRKRREKQKKFNRVSQLNSKDAVTVISDDLMRLNRLLRDSLAEKQKLDDRIVFLEKTIQKVIRAMDFINNMPSEEQELYKDIEMWHKTTELNYIYDMRGMF